MTTFEFVRRVRRDLVAVAAAGSLCVGLSVVLMALGVGSFLRLDPVTRYALSVIVLALILGAAVWKSRSLRSPERVALWVEEAVPTLHYAVVTAALQITPTGDLEQSIHLDALRPAIRKRITAFAWKCLALLAVSVAIYLVSPATSFGRETFHTGLSRALPGVIPEINKVASVRVEVIPPSYTGRKPFERRDVASLSVIRGSGVVISGEGSPDGVTITVDDVRVALGGNEDSWRIGLSVTKPVTVLRASFGSNSRLLVIESIADSPPRVTLSAPLRDTTLRAPAFTVRLIAETSDDIELADGYFEYLIVSGSGEAFSGRTVTSEAVRFASRTGRLSALLEFANLKISPGDLVSVRAIVRDNNSLTGPSVGTSDTRTFRVARADEYDSISVDAAAPPPVDSSAMSQRMLILMTEALVKKQKSLTHQQLVRESDDIATMEDRIRKRVYDILYQTDSPEGVGDTEEPESEIEALNDPDLRRAYNALWDAVRSLRIAEPAAALPPMRVALKALDRARLAKRLYLRGGAPKIVVDVARIRLTGKEKGSSSPRTPRTPADSASRFLVDRFESVMLDTKANPRRLAEELSVLRARAVNISPGFAEALGAVIILLQQNQDAGAALLRARKALSRGYPGNSSPSEWGGG